MSRLLTLGAFSALSFFVGLVVANEIVNGGFESGLLGWSANDAQVESSPVNVFAGSGSALMNAGGRLEQAPLITDAGTYTFEARVKPASANSGANLSLSGIIPTGPELVPDHSFELGTETTTPPFGIGGWWYQFGAAREAVTDAHDGSYVVALQWVGPNAERVERSDIPVVAGETYLVSMRARRLDDFPAKPSAVALQVGATAVFGFTGDVAAYGGGPFFDAPVGEWVFGSTLYVAPATADIGAAAFSSTLAAGPSEQWEIDSISVRRVSIFAKDLSPAGIAGVWVPTFQTVNLEPGSVVQLSGDHWYVDNVRLDEIVAESPVQEDDMPASKVQICNHAIGHVGVGRRIQSLTENSQEARTCNDHYEQALEDLLEEMEWPFATFRVALENVGSPPPEWRYRYRRPVNCRFAREMMSGLRSKTNNQRIPFKIEYADDLGFTVILTDLEDAILRFTAFIDDPNAYSAKFRTALAWGLALQIAGPLRAPEFDRQYAAQAYRLAMGKAFEHALNEGQQEPEPDGETLQERGYYNFRDQFSNYKMS